MSTATKAEWKSIESAPKDGTVIYVRNPKYKIEFLCHWNAKKSRWEGMEFTCHGVVKTCWDESCEPPTLWKPARKAK